MTATRDPRGAWLATIGAIEVCLGQVPLIPDRMLNAIEAVSLNLKGDSW